MDKHTGKVEIWQQEQATEVYMLLVTADIAQSVKWLPTGRMADVQFSERKQTFSLRH
jgi:hypothetical protein